MVVAERDCSGSPAGQPPIDPATNEKITGTYYLWVFNEDEAVGQYNITAYAVPLEPWVDVKEPDYPVFKSDW